MAPEVLQKGICYDSSADWFSFGCMIYKLLRGSIAFQFNFFSILPSISFVLTIGIHFVDLSLRFSPIRSIITFRHSPFRQQKTKDKYEIDKMTLTMVRPASVVFRHDLPYSCSFW